jgi:hypothetical protein
MNSRRTPVSVYFPNQAHVRALKTLAAIQGISMSELAYNTLVEALRLDDVSFFALSVTNQLHIRPLYNTDCVKEAGGELEKPSQPPNM